MTANTQEKTARSSFGAYSEVGKLRKVLVCRPGLAHERMTPANREELLFDDVFWVQQARNDLYDFCTKMQERGVEVLEMHQLLAEAMTTRWRADGCLIARSRPIMSVSAWTISCAPGWRKCPPPIWRTS